MLSQYQTSESGSLDSWCPAEVWTGQANCFTAAQPSYSPPTADVQKHPPPPLLPKIISDFLKYDQVYERCFRETPAAADWLINSVRSPHAQMSKSKAASRAQKKKKKVRHGRKMKRERWKTLTNSHEPLLSLSPAGMTSVPGQLLRRSVVLWVGTMCFGETVCEVLKPPRAPRNQQTRSNNLPEANEVRVPVSAFKIKAQITHFSATVGLK